MGGIPILISPFFNCMTSFSSEVKFWYACNTCVAFCSNAFPASVNSNCRKDLSNSCTPNSSSNPLIVLLNEGCETCKTEAAFVKFNCLATSVKYSKWRISTRFLPLINRSEEHTSELQSRGHLVCRLLLEKKKE